jgi:prophage DNA circulation protein
MILDAKFQLDIKGFEDGFEKAVAIHEIPFIDGGMVEDMGFNVRSVSFVAVFWGNESNRQPFTKVGLVPSFYENYKEVLAHIRGNRFLVLEHPTEGRIAGVVRKCSVSHDEDGKEYCEMSFEFIEEKQKEIFNVNENISLQSEKEYFKTIDQSRKKVADHFKDTYGPEGTQIATKEMDLNKSWVDNFRTASQKIQSEIFELQRNANAFKNKVSAITDLANDITQMVDFAKTLPDQIAQSVAGMVSAYGVAFDSLSGSSRCASIANSIANEITTNNNELLKDLLAVIGSARLNVAMSENLVKDYENRKQLEKFESGKPVNEQGDFIGKESGVAVQVLTIQDVENTLGIVRSLAQYAMNRDRTITGVKVGSQKLLNYVERQILQTESVATRNIHGTFPESFTPFHLVCHKLGQSYRTAERMVKLNKIKCPTFATGFIKTFERLSNE